MRSAPHTVARQGHLLRIDPGRLVLLGAELGVDGVHAVATSLTGEVLARLRSPLDAGRDAPLALVRAAKLLVQLQARLDARCQQVIGIGVGLLDGGKQALAHGGAQCIHGRVVDRDHQHVAVPLRGHCG